MARHCRAGAVGGHHRGAELVVHGGCTRRRLAEPSRAVDHSATAAHQSCGPGVALHGGIQDVVGKDTVPFIITENLHHSCAERPQPAAFADSR